MTLSAGVKRRDTDQPVDSVFSFQIAEGIFTGRCESRALYSGLFTRLVIDDVYLEASSLRPSDIHTKKHFRPILGLGASGSRVDGDNRMFVIVFTAQDETQGKFSDPGIELPGLRFDFMDRVRIVFFFRQFEKHAGIFQFPGKGCEPVDDFGNTGPFF